MENSCKNVFTNTRAREQQERNNIKKQTNKSRREAGVWKEAKRVWKKRTPDGPSHLNQNTIMKKIIWIEVFYTQGNLINKKNGLQQWKNEKSSTLTRKRALKINKFVNKLKYPKAKYQFWFSNKEYLLFHCSYSLA